MKTLRRSPINPVDPRRDPRTGEIYKRLTDPTHPRLRPDSIEPSSRATIISSQWTIVAVKPAPEMVITAAHDLARFFKDSFGVQLSFSGSPRKEKTIRVSIDSTLGRVSGHSQRDHVITIRPDSIEIIGVSEWGAACALYHLQRLLKLRKRPALPRGTIHSYPALEPSLTSLAFKHGKIDELDHPAAYHENYLVRIARAGYTGFHLDPGFHLFYRSHILPELNHPQAEKNMAILRDVVARARRPALDVFMTLYVHMLAADHPVFKRHPKLRGSAIVATNGLHVLCSGQDMGRRFYEEQAERLFRSVPGLGGIFLITGGEGMAHCYTAPTSRPENQTDCPTCRHKDPEKTIARLVNGMAAAVKKVAPDALVTGWTYSAFTWTKTADAVEHVSSFSPECACMSDFDRGDFIERAGVRSMCGDYNLSLVGPSRDYCRQAQAAARRGLKMMAKVESGCPRDIHAVPSIPANTRWARKYARILESGATGAMFAWQFGSFTGSLSEELAGWMSWNPCPPPATLLLRLAARDFGEKNAARVVQAWQWFDRAMDHFPYSGFTSSFRRGPFSIGFAHPLIFNPLQPGDLIPSFWLDAPARQRPMFITDLSWTQPFGVKACLKTLLKTEQAWARGCALLESVTPPANQNTYVIGRIDAHQALARALLCIIRTAIHTVHFMDVRDRYFREPSNLAVTRRRLTEMRAIAQRELANAEDGLRCLRRDSQIGYDYTNAAGFTEAMVLCKLAHTRRLIDWTLPYQMFYYSVTMHRRDEWLRNDGKKWR